MGKGLIWIYTNNGIRLGMLGMTRIYSITIDGNSLAHISLICWNCNATTALLIHTCPLSLQILQKYTIRLRHLRRGDDLYLIRFRFGRYLLLRILATVSGATCRYVRLLFYFGSTTDIYHSLFILHLNNTPIDKVT